MYSEPLLNLGVVTILLCLIVFPCGNLCLKSEANLRALVFEGPGNLSLQPRNLPIPAPNELRIKTAAVGICGTDLHVFDGDFEGAGYPIVPGHEATGWVDALGSHVTNFNLGQPVVINPNVMCGSCEFCQDGRSNLCENWDGRGVMKSDGCAQDYFLAPATNVFALKESTDVYAASLIEPLACVIHAFDRIPRRLGDHFLIYGAGTIGLMVAQLAPRAGAASVTMVDTSKQRRLVAEDLEIETVLESASDSGLDRFDVVIDCSGNPKAVKDALTKIKPGGTFLQIGVTAHDASVELSPFEVYRKELTISGSLIIQGSFRRAVEMFEAGAINHQKMISHSFPLEDFENAMEQFRNGQGRKLQIRPGDSQQRVL